MSFNICSISGIPAQQPVISKKSGHIFEKRLIEKHIDATGRCPITKGELYKEDLLEIKISSNNNSNIYSNTHSNYMSKPVTGNLTSMPGMFSELQKDWENILLETSQLRKELDVARQELAHSLYQKDASCRVICNLLKERDLFREELENYRQEYEDVDEEGFEGEETDFMGVSKDLTRRITELSYKLISERKSRKVNEIRNIPNIGEISEYTVKNTHNPYGSNIGISCADVHNIGQDYILLGSTEGTLALCDLNFSNENIPTVSNKLIVKSFNKSINDVQFCPSKDIFGYAAGSDDGTAAFYISTNTNKEELKFSERYRTGNNIHSQAITSISFHPLEEYALMSSLDGHWSFHNLFKAVILHREFNGIGFSSIKFHPDGGIFATGQVNGILKLWDITSQQEFMKLQDKDMDAVNSISFSENGYYLASCGYEDSTVRIWDIRKDKVVKRLELGNNNGVQGKIDFVSKVEFDKSGNYLTLAGHGVAVCDVKTMEVVNKFESHKNVVTAVKFGGDSNQNYLISTSMDGDLKIHTK